MGTSLLCTLRRPDQVVSGTLYSHSLCSLLTLSASHPSQSWNTGNCLQTVCRQFPADRNKGIKQSVRVTQIASRPTTASFEHLAAGSPLSSPQTPYLHLALPVNFRCHRQSHFLGRSGSCITLVSLHLHRFHLGLHSHETCTTSGMYLMPPNYIFVLVFLGCFCFLFVCLLVLERKLRRRGAEGKEERNPKQASRSARSLIQGLYHNPETMTQARIKSQMLTQSDA